MDGADESRIVGAAAALGMRLKELGMMVATVESCTGGLIARALTETAGSSAWFERGFVTYTNESKSEMAGVDAAIIDAHGAVSEATARAMAVGGLAHSRAQMAIAVTGIAGPGGAVPGKPVGTVCFGWAIASGEVRVATRHFDGGRAQVRCGAALEALEQALGMLGVQPKD